MMSTFLLSLLPSWEKVDTAKRWTEEGAFMQTPLPASLRSATLSHKGRGKNTN